MTVTAESSTATILFAQRYRVCSVLGRGGGADVLHAVDERLKREVALKVFRPGASADAARRFGTEARLLARLRHPGLIEVYDYGVVGEQPYLALELVPGPTLAELLRSHPMPTDQVRRLGRDVAEVLAFVHSHGVVHRDVKPSNVLMDADGRVRLADFGAARLLAEAAAPGDEALTGTGLIIGTPAYLAPEQIRGQGALAAADVYALGLLLLECLTGIREYTGAPIEAAAARLHRPPAIPRSLPAGLARTLRRMTDMDPERRPSAAACARLLTEEEPGGPAGVAAVVHRSLRRTRTGAMRPAYAKPLLAAASLVVLTGLGGSATLDDSPTAVHRPATSPATAPTAAVPSPESPSAPSPQQTAPPAPLSPASADEPRTAAPAPAPTPLGPNHPAGNGRHGPKGHPNGRHGKSPE
ncbi:serine/threonine-protein kinase [Kitasatospora terrestris]|uniref:non-specific serine/threonine protein kinase n=1 Tax=Kitasatospora terrestris TaxID=258051 RepID=A0ABP9DEJ5_9ACTN